MHAHRAYRLYIQEGADTESDQKSGVHFMRPRARPSVRVFSSGKMTTSLNSTRRPSASQENLRSWFGRSARDSSRTFPECLGYISTT
jgi:hypothetical protein